MSKKDQPQKNHPAKSQPAKSQAAGEADRAARTQSAALPWRRAPSGDVQVLLITSRETRRWIIPKGWPIKGLTPPETAAREAFEEAGVKGETGKKKVGVYHYDKRLPGGRAEKVRVAVYPLEVRTEREAWPEASQREKLWTNPAAASELVSEPELADLLRSFQPG